MPAHARSGNRHPPRTSAVVAIGVVMTLLGCGAPPPDPAIVAYRQMFAALGRADATQFVSTLAPPSLDRLKLKLGLAVTVTESELLERLDLRPGATFEVDLPRDAVVVEGRDNPRRRVVQGPVDGAVWRIPVLKVGTGWRVDLFGAEKGPAAGDEN